MKQNEHRIVFTAPMKLHTKFSKAVELEGKTMKFVFNQFMEDYLLQQEGNPSRFPRKRTDHVVTLPVAGR